MIVTVTPTIMDGTVVRWYSSEDAVEYGREMCSASRNGVRVNGYLTDVPADVLAAAQQAYEALRRDDRTDVGHLATHRQRGLFGPYEPVPAKQEAAG
ncbi:hypothetical protein ACGFIY_21235 [Micromonospora chersina]|uniref:hypothetical protein n=1 Tax=Micromonospora chersina TaxID=47854 RepID=UPI00371476B4